MLIRKICSGLAAVALAAGAQAQNFADFGAIPGIDNEPIVQVDITPLAIAIVRGLIGTTDPQAAELLSKLRGIQLRAYDASDKPRQINNFIDEVTNELQVSGWQPVVTVQDEGSRVRVLMRMSEEGISGLTVMVMDSTEAFFINVDASVAIEDLGRIMSTLQLDRMLGPALFGTSGALGTTAD